MASQLRRTKVLLLGLKRSGKTSAFKVVFQQLPPKQVPYIDSTSEIEKHQVDSAIPLEIWDCPASVTIDQLVPLDQFSSIIFVIDMLDRNQPFLARLIEYLLAFYPENPNVHFEIFIHKCESYAEEFKFEMYRLIQQKVIDEIFDLPLPTSATDDSSEPAYFDPEQIVQFHLTSAHDHSVYEAFAKVIHKLIGPMRYLEDLLNVFCASSQLAKTFLFDINCRLYVATDASPVDTPTHSLCCDYVQLIGQLAPIYNADTTPYSCISSAVQLNPDTTLAFWQVTKDLAVLALLPSVVFQARRGIMEYNLLFLRDGIREILLVEHERRGGSAELWSGSKSIQSV